jgi:hypothetical protein
MATKKVTTPVVKSPKATKKVTTPVVKSPKAPETRKITFVVGFGGDNEIAIEPVQNGEFADTECHVRDNLWGDVSTQIIEIEVPLPKTRILKAQIVG